MKSACSEMFRTILLPAARTSALPDLISVAQSGAQGLDRRIEPCVLFAFFFFYLLELDSCLVKLRNSGCHSRIILCPWVCRFEVEYGTCGERHDEQCHQNSGDDFHQHNTIPL